MNDVNKRFILFKINVLKFSLLLTAFVTFFFFLFHIFFQKHNSIIYLEFILTICSFYFYKFVSIKNYKIFSIIEFLLLLLTISFLSVLYIHNVYLPIWLFGALIVFTLCTNFYLGVFFLIVTMIVFDLIFFKRLNFYSFFTLNLQFIAYFIFGIILIKKIETLQKETFIYEKMLIKFSTTDVMTQLFNRRYFEKTGNFLLQKAKRNKTKVLFMLMDIDYFKKINDTYGHPTGDLVLKKVAKTIKNSFRKSDLIGRIGGEEFAVLIEDYKGDIGIADKIRKNIKKLKFKAGDKEFSITISIGGIISTNYNYEYLYKKADEALYEAKKERDKVKIFKD